MSDNEEQTDQGGSEQPAPSPHTPDEPNPDISAPEIEYVINTWDPEKDSNKTILNEKKE